MYEVPDDGQGARPLPPAVGPAAGHPASSAAGSGGLAARDTGAAPGSSA